MVLMALDHARHYFHADAILFDPTDLTRTSPALFITRWVTHFCAPVFVFLAGTGAFLSASRGKTKKELARFLLTRGLWLVVLELTVIHFVWWFDFRYLNAGIIWTLGWSMVVLAGLVFLPARAVTVFGVTMIVFHNLSDGVRAADFGVFHWIWTVLHIPGEFQRPGDVTLKVSYPLVPWAGLMAAGSGFGRLFRLEPRERRKWLFGLGGALTLVFVVLRALNFYGDPSPWSGQKNGVFTFLSFINLEKYPPSLLFLLVTLGPAIVALGLFGRTQEPGAFVRALIVLRSSAIVFLRLTYFSHPRFVGCLPVHTVWPCGTFAWRHSLWLTSSVL